MALVSAIWVLWRAFTTQRRDIGELRAIGASVLHKSLLSDSIWEKDPNEDVWCIYFPNSVSTNELDRVLDAIDSFHAVELIFERPQFGAEAIQRVACVPNLSFLAISGKQFDNRSIRELSKSQTLQAIRLSNSSATVDGLCTLANAHSLRMLWIDNLAVSDNELLTIRQHLPHLEAIIIDGTILRAKRFRPENE